MNLNQVDRTSADAHIRPEDIEPMTLELSGGDANRISFPDCSISAFTSSADRVEFLSDGIFVEDEGLFRSGMSARCIVSGTVSARCFADLQWTMLEPASAEGLRDIGEWEAQDGTLTFAGFQQSSDQWSEFRVTDFSLSVTVFAEA